MNYNKKDLLWLMSCPHCKHSTRFCQIQKSPYFEPLKSKFNRIGRQCCNLLLNYREKIRLASEGFQKSSKRKQINKKATLQPIPSFQKLQSLNKNQQENDAQYFKNEKLRKFLQNHDQMIKEWEIRDLMEKQGFVSKLINLQVRKGKSFSLKKKRKDSKNYRDLAMNKNQRNYSEANQASRTVKNRIIPQKHSEKVLKRLKTIQSSMYKEHLLNLVRINEKNQLQKLKMKNDLILQAKKAQQNRIKQQRKKLKEMQKQFENILRQKNQVKCFQQLREQQKSEISDESLLQTKENRQKLRKKANQLNHLQLPFEQKSLAENPELEKDKNSKPPNHYLRSEASTLGIEKTEQNSMIHSKIAHNITRINQRKVNNQVRQPKN